MITILFLLLLILYLKEKKANHSESEGKESAQLTPLSEKEKREEAKFYKLYILSIVVVPLCTVILRYTVGANMILPENEGYSVRNEGPFILSVRIFYFLYLILFLIFLPKVKAKLSVVFPTFVFCSGFVLIYTAILYNGWAIFVAPEFLLMMIPAALIGKLVSYALTKNSKREPSDQ